MGPPLGLSSSASASSSNDERCSSPQEVNNKRTAASNKAVLCFFRGEQRAGRNKANDNSSFIKTEPLPIEDEKKRFVLWSRSEQFKIRIGASLGQWSRREVSGLLLIWISSLARNMNVHCGLSAGHFMKRYHFLPLILLSAILSEFAQAQTSTLSGTVRDHATGEPLVAANIRVEGTSRGTITNAQGYYRLSLEAGRHVVIFSFIGYRSDTLRVDLSGPLEHNASLEPAPIQMAEVLVIDEDPAVAIMRRVIENKKRWIDSLASYQFDAFTRMVMRRDTAIAMITESYTAGYWRKGDTLREVVRQKRQTENIAGTANFAAVGGIVNFYDDDVRFSGFTFVGPTSTEAFEYYDFKLEKTRERDGVPTYTIRLNPKTRLTPLFRGTINVIGDTYALVGVEITPNEAFSIPFLSKLELHYAQQFGLYENRFWMPVDIRLKGMFEVSIVGLSLPQIGVEQASSIYDYRINAELPDSVFRKPRRLELPGASRFDSLFWAQRDVLPLTDEERQAYKKLDSTQTLEKQFRPSGVLVAFSSPSLGYLRYANVRFNRVEGLLLGVDVKLDSVANRLALFGTAGYAFADKKSKFSFGGEFFLDRQRNYSVGIEGYKDLGHIPDEGFYSEFAIMGGALLGKSDYRDYFYTEGWRIWLGAKPIRRLALRLAYQSRDESTARKQTDYSLFYRSDTYRPNPPIADGTMRSLMLSARYGDEPVPLGLIAQDFAELDVEHSNPGILSSAFDFTRAIVRGEVHLKTYSQRLLFAPTLSLRLTAGASRGVLPPQRIFSLESRYDGFGPLGVLRGGSVKEFSGHQFVMFSLEHNFRNTPFLILNIPFLYKNGIELIAHATFARSWSSSPLPFGRTTNGWYSEAGLGLSRLFGLFRLDYTYRFAHPRNAFISLGVAQLL